MKVEIDNFAGFCWGVVRAIDFAESELASDKLYSLGDIIHNPSETGRLKQRGLNTISVDDLDKLPRGSRVLIRAHGEPPSTYQKAMELGIEIIDATCPVVTKVQERIRKFFDSGYQVVIFGKKDHAEVIGLRGVTEDKAIVVLTVEEALEKVNLTVPTVLFSQTTMDKNTFSAIAEALRERITRFETGSIEETAVEFHAKDTICGQVSGREKKLREFARSYDLVLFVSGRKSSNGKVLYHIAIEENPNTKLIESESDLEAAWFENVNTVGISGATSTPGWVMEGVRKTIIEKFLSHR